MTTEHEELSEHDKRWAEAVGATLRAERAVAGLSQAELARRAGITRTSYRLYELGKRQPNVTQLVKIAGVLRVKLSVLAAEMERRARDDSGLTHRDTSS